MFLYQSLFCQNFVLVLACFLSCNSLSAGLETQAVWIGLSDEDAQDVYTWYPTGEVATWFNWASNEPNGEDRENCVSVISSGLFNFEWADCPCDENLFFFYFPLCEHDPLW